MNQRVAEIGEALGGLASPPPVIAVAEPPVALAAVVARPSYRYLKRALDLLAGTLALLALSPVLLAVTLAIKITSPGPVFYRWNVVGRGGRRFCGYKFRTMVVGADLMKSELSHLNEMQGPVFKIKRDPRVTPIGRFLRKYSIDELPQLWSVVRGDMSLVGPRPVAPHEWAEFEPWQREKLSVTPGMSCLWQVSGRNAISDFDQWVALDLDYIRRWSLRLDLEIMAKTVGAVARGTGH